MPDWTGMKTRMPLRDLLWITGRSTIVGLVVVITVVSLGLSAFLGSGKLAEWAAELLLNLGFLSAGLLSAYWIGERLIQDAERSRWASVEQAIERRAIRTAMTALSAFVDAPTLRSAVKMSSPERIPPYAFLVANPVEAHRFASVHLLPVIAEYTTLRPPPHKTTNFTTFELRDWTAIQTGMERATPLSSQTIVLFGERPAPALQAAMLDLDSRLARYLDIDNNWGLQRSGQGEMAYQVQKLMAAEQVARKAVDVLQALADGHLQRRSSVDDVKGSDSQTIQGRGGR